MKSATLEGWLAALEARTPQSRIDLGLDRPQRVWDRLKGSHPDIAHQVVVVGGTNGKGSCVAFLEAMARAHGHSTFTYTSPHITLFNERVRVDGQMVDDATWLQALEHVDQVRDDEPLTWFEHVTLAAFVMAQRIGPDVAILEVGLGGRLDAVNVMDADVAVITSIGLDHTDWLGPTRDHIAREKLGIARAGRGLVVGERDWPTDSEAALTQSHAQIHRVGQAFERTSSASPCDGSTADDWQMRWLAGPEPKEWSLPKPTLGGHWQIDNAMTAIAAWVALVGLEAVDEVLVGQALKATEIPGRFERVAQSPEVILDVGHNAQAAQVLAETLGLRQDNRKTVAVFSALQDKAVDAMASHLAAVIDHWYVAPLPGPRGQSSESIEQALRAGGVTQAVDRLESLPEALEAALAAATRHDRIVVLGSFSVLSELRPRWRHQE